ncbi:WXG100-like domain-containing protein, partial [Nocardia rhizosphaerihabitans]|uniref:WXG100-like domain-containing protein n=1 Tax=Nocardia rhizosphaerihabitans TaxID=1691570 RepID=UPI001669CF27
MSGVSASDLKLPEEIQFLSWVAGGAWPRGSENGMFALADAWDEAGSGLAGVVANVEEVVKDILGAYSSQSDNSTLARTLKSLTDESEDVSLQKIAEAMKQISKSCDKVGCAIEENKWMIIIGLLQLVIEIAWALSNPVTAVTVPAKIALYKLIFQWLKVLLWEMLKGAISAMLIQMVLNSLLQAGQMAAGHRENFDTQSFGAYALGGFMGGAFGGLFGKIGGDLFKQLGKQFTGSAFDGMWQRIATGFVAGGAGGVGGMIGGGLSNQIIYGQPFELDPRMFASGFGAGLSGGARGVRAPKVSVHMDVNPKLSAGSLAGGPPSLAPSGSRAGLTPEGPHSRVPSPSVDGSSIGRTGDGGGSNASVHSSGDGAGSVQHDQQSSVQVHGAGEGDSSSMSTHDLDGTGFRDTSSLNSSTSTSGDMQILDTGSNYGDKTGNLHVSTPTDGSGASPINENVNSPKSAQVSDVAPGALAASHSSAQSNAAGRSDVGLSNTRQSGGTPVAKPSSVANLSASSPSSPSSSNSSSPVGSHAQPSSSSPVARSNASAFSGTDGSVVQTKTNTAPVPTKVSAENGSPVTRSVANTPDTPKTPEAPKTPDRPKSIAESVRSDRTGSTKTVASGNSDVTVRSTASETVPVPEKTDAGSVAGVKVTETAQGSEGSGLWRALTEERWRMVDSSLTAPVWPGLRGFIHQIMPLTEFRDWLSNRPSSAVPHEVYRPHQGNDLPVRDHYGWEPSGAKDGDADGKPVAGKPNLLSRNVHWYTEKERAPHRFTVGEDLTWKKVGDGDDAPSAGKKSDASTRSGDSAEEPKGATPPEVTPVENLVGDDGDITTTMPRYGPLLKRWGENEAQTMRTVVVDHDGNWYISAVEHESFHNAGVYAAFEAQFVKGKMTAVLDWAGAYEIAPARTRKVLTDLGLYETVEHFDRGGRKYSDEDKANWYAAEPTPSDKSHAEGAESTGGTDKEYDTEGPLEGGVKWDDIADLGDEPKTLSKIDWADADIANVKVAVLGDKTTAHYIWRAGDGTTTENSRWRQLSADGDGVVEKDFTGDISDVLSDPRLTEFAVPADTDIVVKKTSRPDHGDDDDALGAAGRRDGSGEGRDRDLLTVPPPREDGSAEPDSAPVPPKDPAATAKHFEDQAREILDQHRRQADEWSERTTEDLTELLKGAAHHDDPARAEDYRRAVGAAVELILREDGKTAYQTQVMGTMAMHAGPIRMAAGEGKSLVFMATAMLMASSGDGPVHVYTTRDTLADKAFADFSKTLKKYGFEIGRLRSDSLPEGLTPDLDPAAPPKPTIYVGTVSDGVFGRMRGIEVPGKRALIDEIDEALGGSSSFILADRGGVASEHVTTTVNDAQKFLSKHLADGTLTLEHFGKTDERVGPAKLTPEGVKVVEELLRAGGPRGPKGLDPQQLAEQVRAVEMAATARWEYPEQDSYIIDEKNQRVVIIDKVSHKVMADAKTSTESRWNGGLAQAIEAKHGLPVRSDTGSAQSMTAKEFFAQYYDKVTGASGTPDGAAAVLAQLGAPEIVSIPRNKDSRLTILDTVAAVDQPTKHRMIADEIIAAHRDRPDPRPILMIANRNSEVAAVSDLLGPTVKHVRVDADQFLAWGEHAEGNLLKLLDVAGQSGSVLLINRQGGRGVDIFIDKLIDKAGGLHVLVTSKSDLRDIDIQAESRAARNGQQGSARYYMAADDELFAHSPDHQISVIQYRDAVADHHAAVATHTKSAADLDAAVAAHDAAVTARDTADTEHQHLLAESTTATARFEAANADYEAARAALAVTDAADRAPPAERAGGSTRAAVAAAEAARDAARDASDAAAAA